jgi:GTP-binding protein EngB required for normal cell division
MLGRKIGTKEGLDFYVYPQIKLTNEDKESSSNIMIIGETGVGKSTWIHSFINYIQGIQLEENSRYLLFDEKSLQEEYQKIHGKKPEGCSVTDVPAIYNIGSSVVFNNPIRLIDTAGFGDTRGPQYDEKITVDIQNLFNGSEIENLNAVCLIFKANQTRATERLELIMNKLFSLFGKEIRNNIIIIFTFADNFKNIEGVNTLKNKDGIFYKILGNIDQLPFFALNSIAYFNGEKDLFEKIYENNTKNFGSLPKYIFSLGRISLESTKKVINILFSFNRKKLSLCCFSK